MTETPASIRKEIKTFLGLTIVISAVAYIPLIASFRVGGTFALGAMLALVWAPGIAALATRYHNHEEIYGMGWGWGLNGKLGETLEIGLTSIPRWKNATSQSPLTPSSLRRF